MCVHVCLSACLYDEEKNGYSDTFIWHLEKLAHRGEDFFHAILYRGA